MEQEYIYIISQKAIDGNFHKIAKSQDMWWYTESEARSYLTSMEPIMQISCAVFKVLATFTEIEKVFDVKVDSPGVYKELLKLV